MEDTLHPNLSTIIGCVKHTSGLCQYSPDGRLIALGNGNRLVLRDTISLEILETISCIAIIEKIEWSFDSRYVLCSIPKKSVVEIWAVGYPEWRCRITEGVADLCHTRWVPNRHHVITVADFNLHLSIWTLDKPEDPVLIKTPKLGANGISFSGDSKYMGVAHRSECRDKIGIYSTETWELIRMFEVASTDLEEISWSPVNSAIAIRDSLLEFRVLVYDPLGNLLINYQAYENALGIKTMSWSPCGSYLSVGSYDETLRLLNSLTFKTCAEFQHTSIVSGRDDGSTKVFREIPVGNSSMDDPRNSENKTQNNTSDHYAIKPSSMAPKRYSREQRRPAKVHVSTFLEQQSKSPNATNSKPWQLKTISPDLTKLVPRQGIGLLTWCPDGNYVATRNDNMPHALWVWSVHSAYPLAVIELHGRIVSCKWQRVKPEDSSSWQLAIVSATSKVFFWSIDRDVESLDLSQDTTNPVESTWDSRGVRWSPDSNQLLVISKSQVAVVNRTVL